MSAVEKPPAIFMNDEYFLRRCLKLAAEALEKGDAPVGSLIARNGVIITETIESVRQLNDPTAHAEMLAVRLACAKLSTLDLSDCVLYTNVEPCWMCAYAIRQTQISRICFSSINVSVGGINSKFPVLLDENLKPPTPTVHAGTLAPESDALLAEFRKRKK